MKQQHTPGPWRVDGRAVVANRIEICVCSQDRIDSIGQIDGHANARLIAAAPDMLETLEAIHELLTDPKFEEYPSRDLERDIARWADEAIRKATETGQ